MTRTIERLAAAHQQLLPIYEHDPLARLLVESAGQLKQMQGQRKASYHTAYKDWLWAVFGQDNKAYYDVLSVIDALLPDHSSESSGIVSNPALPGLPPRPERTQQTMKYRDEKEIFQGYTMNELLALEHKEKQRHQEMRQLLESIAPHT